MSVIDLEKEIIADIKNQSSQAGLALYNFDLSKLQVTAGNPVYKQPQVQQLHPVAVDERNYCNCTRQPRSERVLFSHTSTSQYSITLNSTLHLSKGMSSTIKAVATVVLGSNFSAQLDLTMGAQHSGSRQERIDIDATTTVAPCTNLKAVVMESKAVFKVDFTIPVLVVGNVPCYLDVPMHIDPPVDWSYSQKFDIHGSAAVQGVQLDKRWEEYRANCPNGTPCKKTATAKPKDSWSLETWEESNGSSEHK